MLHKEHPLVWNSTELARSSVRYWRGRNSPTERRSVKVPVPSTCPSIPNNPWKLPAAEPEDFLPYVVSVGRDTKVGVMGDLHIPYHNIPAITATLQQFKKSKCGIIILNGDTLDFHRLSRFVKDPGSRDAKEEIDRANQLLDVLDEEFPKAKKIWKDGNHDERYDLFLAANSAELYKLVKEKCSLDKLLELEERGWDYVTGKRPIHLGKLTLLHGHEMPTPVIGPVNAARGLFLRTKASAMVSHHHQTSEHSEPDIRDKMITTWSLGALCNLHPNYARFNRWNHGAAEVDLAASGDFAVHNFRITNGKIMN